jgi:hypothetical protein
LDLLRRLLGVFFATRCCGGLLATTSTARSKRCQALGSSSISSFSDLRVFGMANLTISKLDAAHRQLRTAIQLWFADGDPVSIHTLSYAAYEIIHAASKRLNPTRSALLFDTKSVKDEFRREFITLVKKDANFFKHANRHGEEQIELFTEMTELFLMFGVLGIADCNIPHSDEDAAYLAWVHVHHPQFLTEQGQRKLLDNVPVEVIAGMRLLQKQEFLEMVSKARAEVRHNSSLTS